MIEVVDCGDVCQGDGCGASLVSFKYVSSMDNSDKQASECLAALSLSLSGGCRDDFDENLAHI